MSRWFRFLNKNEPLSVYFFAVPRNSLNLMGYWPGGGAEKKDKKNKNPPLRAYVHFVILAIGVFTELHAGMRFLHQEELTLALETFCPAATSAVTLLKMFLMWRYRQDLASMWCRLRSLLFETGRERPDQQEIRLRHSLLAVRINCWPVSAGFLTGSIYNIKPVMIALVLYLQQRSDENVWVTPYNMTMPPFLLKSPFFPFTYLFTAYTGYVTIFMFGGCDGFYFEFCSHVSALFEILQSETKAIFKPYKDRLTIDSEEALHLEQQLRAIVVRHNAVIDLTKSFRQRYAIITLAHFVSAAMVIGFSMVNLLTVGGIGLGVILYVAYTIAAASQLLVYCYGGTLVAESSLGLARILFACPWNICWPNQRRYVQLLILRSQRALTMAVPFFSPSLAAFASILQTSGSIIALFKSFQ
ncbi:odorant receptor 10a isoform X1 [Drosophila bipectinata]|uniref:odorant receptor 10a isoform X1 n=2 Tax=Drosophila bipectinata TaxID=42026 RepID=UPI001C8AC149|nr:odorant receptor 10a isoform X2 [Drosophila bipectinata]